MVESNTKSKLKGMTSLHIKRDPKVELVFDNYPAEIRQKLEYLRTLIIETAKKIEGLGLLEETLKWGEPSYLVKKGSTIRMDWKAKNPNQYALYFKCTSRLVPTFREIFKNQLNFEGNRAIVFDMDETINEEVVKYCITLALTYHKVKHLPMLGA